MKTCASCGRENADEAVDCRECGTQEFKTPEGKANAAPVVKVIAVRVIAAVGCLVFLGLALKMGAESFHARSVGSPMGNWKGGTMEYSDGFKLTAIFGALAGVWCYCAIRPKSIVESWSRRRNAPK